jgi:hypothetical protein
MGVQAVARQCSKFFSKATFLSSEIEAEEPEMGIVS